MILKLLGYDRHGEVRHIDTTLEANALGTLDVSLAAMAFNAPAWVTAASMSTLYAVMGAAAPLAILISLVFPMGVLALCLVYLTRQAPTAGGIFTFSSRFLHPVAGTILGWAYTVSCAAITPMTAIIATEYIQALVPGAHGALAANLIATGLIVVFTLVCLRGVTLTAKVTTVLLSCELTVIVGLGLLGIFAPRVPVPTADLFRLPHDWSVLGAGVLLGMWLLANFDSAINYIEEARVPVRTVQRSLLAVLGGAFLVYMIAAIGWQRAVPVETLARIAENGDGGPIGAVANVYLPPALTWLALAVVITSALAGLQVSMTAGARTAYRMAREGHLPAIFGRINGHKAPWVSVVAIAATGVVFVWYKPLAEVNFYYNTVVVTLALAYMSALAAFMRLMFVRLPAGRALAASVLPLLACAVLGYLMYSAGAAPAEPKDLHQAWYIGLIVLATSLVIVLGGRRDGRGAALAAAAQTASSVSTSPGARSA